MLFDFVSMAGNYDNRKLARYETAGTLIVDTCLVSDSDEPYETAVSHPSYKSGKWIIVETYSTKKDACKGHGQWVKRMAVDTLPASLVDVSTADIAKLARAVGVSFTYERQAPDDKPETC